jgi:hypothetical protein
MWTYTVPIYRNRTLPTLDEMLADPITYHVEERDLALMEALFFRRFLTSEQIRREFFPPQNPGAKDVRRACQARLRLLYKRCFIDRFRPPSTKGDGSHPYVYTLDRPGYQLLKHLRPERMSNRWSFREKVLQFTKVIHELELNEFCLTFREEAAKRGIEVTWLTTRQAIQKVKLVNGGRSPVYAPDAMLIWRTDQNDAATEQVLHVEYERSADKRWFLEKILTWKEYRRLALWKKVAYPKEPKILVVGQKKALPRAGWGSIEVLRKAAKAQQMQGIFFLYLEDLKRGKWDIITPRDEKTTIWDLQETTQWDRMRDG